MNHTPITFAAVAAQLAANGYRPVPIKPGGKRPPLDGWQHYAYAAGDEKRFSDCGAGILCADTPGIDIDVDDEDAEAAVETAIRETLGLADVAEIPRRIGRYPRVLLPCRTGAPFAKLRSADYRMRASGEFAHVEVLCDGQQFVAFHVHPDTHRPYVWNGGGDLLTVRRDDLPEIDEAKATRIVAAAEAALEEWGDRVEETRDERAQGATPGDKIAGGARNDTLYRYGCRLAREGFTGAEIEAALLALNARRCAPALEPDEVRTIAGSAAKHAKEQTVAPKLTVELARLPADWIEVDQHPPPFVVERLLPESEAGSLVAPGSFGKSTLKLFESVHIILGRDLYGRHVLKPGAVLCVSKEDRASLIDYRLKQICHGLRLSDTDMQRVQRHFLRLDLRGDAFMLQRVGADRIPFRSADLSELLTAFQGEGIASAWFDTASRFGTGEGNQEAAVMLEACTVLADAWHCAVEVLHHVSQGIARTGTVDMHASRGGTAFIDNGRFARQLVRHTGDTLPGAISYRPPTGIDANAETLLRMHVVKLTGARFDMHAPVWIERRNDWGFVHAAGDAGERPSREDRQAEARSERAGVDDEAVVTFIREHLARIPPQRLTQNALDDSRDRIVRGMSQRRVRDAVGRLRLDGVLIDAPLPGKVTRGPRTFLAPTGWQEPL